MKIINRKHHLLQQCKLKINHSLQSYPILSFVFQESIIRRSLARQDKDGRTVGHYLFNAPELIWKLGKFIPWTTRDKNGQSPLSVLAKTWDHRDYQSMLSAAITACARVYWDEWSRPR